MSDFNGDGSASKLNDLKDGSKKEEIMSIFVGIVLGASLWVRWEVEVSSFLDESC